MNICLWYLAYTMLISYLSLFIFILVFCLCSVHRGSFRLGRSLRCTKLINFFWMVFMGQGFSRGSGGRVDWTRHIAVIAEKLNSLAMLYMFSGVSLYLCLLSCFVTKNFVLVKKVGFIYGMSYLFCVLKIFVPLCCWLCMLLFLFIISVG